VRGFGLRSHFESGLGVGLQGEFAAGPATLLRIGGTKLERLWLAEGEVTRTGAAEDLCRTQVEVTLPEDALASLLRDPLGNHLLLVAGHHAARLREWWEMMIPR
jgi:L-fucose isomerase-like protein